MELLDTSDEIDIQRVDMQGEYVYVHSSGNTYNEKGTLLGRPKFESCFEGGHQLKNKTDKEEVKEKTNKQTNSQTMSLSQQFLDETKDYTQKVMEHLLQKYEGKVVGGDDFNLDVLMKDFFEGEPSDLSDTKKSKKKKKKGDGKKKALSGYNVFQKEMKDEFKPMIPVTDPKTSLMAFGASKWKELSDEQKGEWNQKAKELLVNVDN